jgi:hypothetical protein
VTLNVGNGYSNYCGWTTQFTKRFSGRWQASGNYTLSLLKDAAGWNTLGPIPSGFKLAPDLGEEYTDAVGDQRHRATLNGIYDLGRGFQASGLYFFGSGERYATSYGGDLRRVGVGSTGRLRPDGTIVPRNNFVGDPIHRVDVRLQKRVPLGGRVVIDVIGEVFNLFNHANYAVYTTSESSRAYGKPSPTTALPFSPRMGQFAFRLGF